MCINVVFLNDVLQQLDINSFRDSCSPFSLPFSLARSELRFSRWSRRMHASAVVFEVAASAIHFWFSENLIYSRDESARTENAAMRAESVNIAPTSLLLQEEKRIPQFNFGFFVADIQEYWMNFRGNIADELSKALAARRSRRGGEANL